VEREAKLAAIMKLNVDRDAAMKDERALHLATTAGDLEKGSRFFRGRDKEIASDRAQRISEVRLERARPKDTRVSVPGKLPPKSSPKVRSPKPAAVTPGSSGAGVASSMWNASGGRSTHSTPTNKMKSSVGLMPANAPSPSPNAALRVELNALTDQIAEMGTEAVTSTPGGSQAAPPPSDVDVNTNDSSPRIDGEIPAQPDLERPQAESQSQAEAAASLQINTGQTGRRPSLNASAPTWEPPVSGSENRKGSMYGIPVASEKGGGGVNVRGSSSLADSAAASETASMPRSSVVTSAPLTYVPDAIAAPSIVPTSSMLTPSKLTWTPTAARTPRTATSTAKKTVFDSLYEDRVYKQAHREALQSHHTADFLGSHRERVTPKSHDEMKEVVQRLAAKRDLSKTQELGEKLHTAATAGSQDVRVSADRSEKVFDKLNRSDLESRHARARARLKRAKEATDRPEPKLAAKTCQVTFKGRRRVLGEIFDVLLASVEFRRQEQEEGLKTDVRGGSDGEGSPGSSDSSPGSVKGDSMVKDAGRDAGLVSPSKSNKRSPCRPGAPSMSTIDPLLDLSHYQEVLGLIQPLELSQSLSDVLRDMKQLLVTRETFFEAMESYLDSVHTSQALLDKGYPPVTVLIINRAMGRGPAASAMLAQHESKRALPPTKQELEMYHELTLKPALVGPSKRRDEMARRHHERMLGKDKAAEPSRQRLLSDYQMCYMNKGADFKKKYEREKYRQCTFQPNYFTKTSDEGTGLARARAKLHRLQQGGGSSSGGGRGHKQAGDGVTNPHGQLHVSKQPGTTIPITAAATTTTTTTTCSRSSSPLAVTPGGTGGHSVARRAGSVYMPPPE
jgi:hypothetical protein